MKFLPERCELRGIFKCNGIDHGSSSWKSGVLLVSLEDNTWKLSLFSGNGGKVALHKFQLSPDMIRKIICKAQLVVELNDTGRSSVHFKLNPPSATGMIELHNLLLDIKSGKAASEMSKSLKDFNASPVKVATEQQFTSVKENKRSERGSKYPLDDCDEGSKENWRGTISNSEKFLQRGQEKSRECLQSLPTKGFYGSPTQSSLFSTYGSSDKTRTSTPAHGRLYGSFAANSSIKRTPGMMPDPTPSKKLRLSDASPTYSWQKSKSGQQSDKKQQMSLQGFSNLGNTCYMNAILQALFGLDTFTADLLLNNRKIHKQMSQQSLYFSLAKLLHSRRRSASDLVRRDLLRAVKTSISTTVRRFSGYQQHDAHEFLIQVIDQLKEEVQKVCNATPSPNREETRGETSSDRQEFLNPATINFEFEVTHSISCLECDEVVTKCEQFNDLSLDMPKRRDLANPRSIQHALEHFFKKEKIEYTCEKCGNNKSEVTHTFTKLPRVLILHLKRYNYDVMASRNTKMAQSIQIPQYLTLQSHCSEQTQPPHPTYWPSLLPSPQKLIIDPEEDKDVISRRRLDYNSGFHFKKTTSSEDLKNSTLNDLDKTSPTEQNMNKDEESMKPITLDDDMDPDLARVLEMSLKEHTERQERLHDTGEDDEFERVMELSRQNNLNSTHTVPEGGVYDEKILNGLSEEEQLRLAIEQSLRDSMLDQTAELDYHDNCSVKNENIESRPSDIENVSSSLDLADNQCSETEQNKYYCKEESKLDLKTVSQNNEYCQDNISDLCESKSLPESETKELFSEDIQFLDDVKQLSDLGNDVNSREKVGDENECTVKCKTSVLKEKDVCNTTDFDLLCNEPDVGWMSLENKENKLPNQNENKMVSNSEEKYSPLEDASGDSDSEKDISIVDNEKGDLPYSYRLVSIVNHIGSTSVAGHYICDVHDIKKNGWYSFDDSHVSAISATDVYTKREKCGYIFFYISKEIFEDVQEHYALMTKNKKN